MNSTEYPIMDDVLNLLIPECISVVITGSRVDATFLENSDVDLIILVEKDSQVGIVNRLIRNFQKSSRSRLFDCKVFTEIDLSKAKNGPIHFFIWTCLSRGRVIHGRDITKEVSLNPNLVRGIVWTHTNEVTEACYLLDTQIHFTGACYKIYSALKTVYFVERFIFSTVNHAISNKEFIEMHLEESYPLIHGRYNWVNFHIDDSVISQTFQVPTSIDKRFSSDDYVKATNSGKITLDILQKTYVKISEWVEAREG